MKQESTSITQHFQLWKLGFRTFLVLKDACTPSTGPPWQWKQLYLIFSALKQKSTSIKEPQLAFRTFMVLKHDCTTSTTMKVALSDLPSTKTGIHKHCTTSTLVKTDFSNIPGSETRPHSLHRTTMKVKTTSSDLPSTETRVHEHCTTSTVVEIVLVHILGTERCLCNFHNRGNDFIWSSLHWNRSTVDSGY